MTEEKELSRRQFLGTTGGLVAGLSAASWLAESGAALPRQGPSRDVIVHVLLRGGMDGLTLCVPHGDRKLYSVRPNVAIQPPGLPNGAIDLDGFFGLAPAAAPLLTPYVAGHLAIVHAAGSTDPTRSHFDALSRMELGIPAQPPSVNTGWLARHLLTTPPVAAGPLRAVAITGVMPKTLAGAPRTLTIPDLAIFGFPGNVATATIRRQTLNAMFASEPPPMGPAALDTFGSIDMLSTVHFGGYVPSNGAVYWNFGLGYQMRQAAALIKADKGVEAIFLELVGWDTHDDQGSVDGMLALLLDELCHALEAFYIDMLDQIDQVTVVVMTEFGRRVAQNASLGTDHGHGSCMLVMGGAVLGGQVLTQWPGLESAQLDHGDLAITTDYRDVLAEVLVKRVQNNAITTVFPNHTPNFPGVIA